MNNMESTQERLEALKGVPALINANEKTLQHLADASELISLKQGQTLLRSGVIETHAFLLIEGSLRLLAENQYEKELFTVGRVDEGGTNRGGRSALRQGDPVRQL